MDNNTLPSFSPTQLCNSGPYTSSAVYVEVIDGSSCSDTFTSRLSYNATLRMGSSNSVIQVDCSIVPDPPGSTPLPGCSPMTVLSHFERNSGFTWCVTNCTGMYVWIKLQLHDDKKNVQTDKSKSLTKGCFNCSLVHCDLLSIGSRQLYIIPVKQYSHVPEKGDGTLNTFMA